MVESKTKYMNDTLQTTKLSYKVILIEEEDVPTLVTFTTYEI